MEIKNIAEILEEFSRDYTSGDLDVDFFSDFIRHNDIGIPLAQSIVYELAQATSKGEEMLIDTWNSFCELLEVDPNGDYECLDDIFDEIEED